MNYSISSSPRLYLQRQVDNGGRYVLEQMLQALVGWVPTIAGIGLRAEELENWARA